MVNHTPRALVLNVLSKCSGVTAGVGLISTIPALATTTSSFPFVDATSLNDGDSVILVGPGVWVKGYPGYGTYAATKAALRSFVRTWTTELKDRKIRANLISPGAVETPIIDGQFPTKEAADGARQWFRSIIPLGRLGNPEEIASAALFLASDESSYILGNDLVVDGGATAV